MSGTPPEAGNVWFADPEPPEPMSLTEKLAVVAIVLTSVAGSIAILAMAFGWL